jgi:uncharacterized lipoprotein YddW (UPF0748 family)
MIGEKLFDRWADGLVDWSRRWGRQGWIVFLFIFALILATHLSWPPSGGTQTETMPIRGVWLTNIDSDVLFEQKTLRSAIATLKELNFNTIYPTVWNWGYTLYPSRTANKISGRYMSPEPGLQGRDILKEIIAAAHQKDIRVIPWFEFGFMAPADSELAKRHLDWLTQRQDGSKIWWEGKAHQRVWFNPLRPEVQQFIGDLLLEIIERYDVEGIQVDDHFGFPVEFGYDDYTVSLYQKEHDGQSPPSDFRDAEWVQWRSDKITAYVGQLYQRLKQGRPKTIFSVSPNPQGFSLQAYLLDWYKWHQQQNIDELIVQVYRTELESFTQELAQPELVATKADIPVGIGVLSGLKGRPMAMEQINGQVNSVKQQGFAGVSFFFYESLWNLADEPADQRQAAFKALFSAS